MCSKQVLWGNYDIEFFCWLTHEVWNQPFSFPEYKNLFEGKGYRAGVDNMWPAGHICSCSLGVLAVFQQQGTLPTPQPVNVGICWCHGSKKQKHWPASNLNQIVQACCYTRPAVGKVLYYHPCYLNVLGKYCNPLIGEHCNLSIKYSDCS